MSHPPTSDKQDLYIKYIFLLNLHDIYIYIVRTYCSYPAQVQDERVMDLSLLIWWMICNQELLGSKNKFITSFKRRKIYVVVVILYICFRFLKPKNICVTSIDRCSCHATQGINGVESNTSSQGTLSGAPGVA